jgi:hypothetical protein
MLQFCIAVLTKRQKFLTVQEFLALYGLQIEQKRAGTSLALIRAAVLSTRVPNED